MYKYYGAVGIECRLTVDDVRAAWERDQGWRLTRPSLNRIDLSGHYEVGNVRFIELVENVARASAARKAAGLKAIRFPAKMGVAL